MMVSAAISKQIASCGLAAALGVALRQRMQQYSQLRRPTYARPPRSLSDPITPEESRSLRMLQLEYDTWLADGEPLPERVSDKQWLRLVRECPTEDDRKRLYSRFLYYEKKQRMKRSSSSSEGDSLSSNIANASMSDVYPQVDDCPYLPQINRRAALLPDEHRLAYSLQFGQPLVLDMRYGSSPAVDPMSLAMCALHSYGANRNLAEPFHLHVCSASPRHEWYRLVRSHFVQEKSSASTESRTGGGRQWPDDFLATITQSSVTELFSRRSLVYLSPNSGEVMQKFDHDAVYVIGGLMDRKLAAPGKMLSLETAAKLRVRSMCLPVQIYADWDYGTWCLSPVTVIRILGDVRQTGNWYQAFKQHLPPVNRPSDQRTAFIRR